MTKLVNDLICYPEFNQTIESTIGITELNSTYSQFT